MSFDCHQHLWPPALVDALRSRTTYPYLRGWTLHLAGEPPYEVKAADHDVTLRRDAGFDEVLLSLSSPLGIEHLPGDEGAALIDIWHESAVALGAPFKVWAAASVASPDPGATGKTLIRDEVAGLQLPATALTSPADIDRLGPLLDAAAGADKPVLIHPGPAPACDPGLPGWWPALVPYVSQLHQSWLAWHIAGRARHPRLRIAFVALAGLAPLHHERLAARGGALGPLDPYVYYETSSYGPRAVDALVRVVGIDPIVHGSDRPYAEPLSCDFGDAFTHAVFTANPRHLLYGEPR